MKPKDQRVAIAKACGWNEKPSPSPDGAGMGFPARKPEWSFMHQLPDYLNSLDAMHEAVVGMTAADRHEMSVNLRIRAEVSQTWSCCDSEHWSVAVHATAAQRAEAFLRALNLWTA